MRNFALDRELSNGHFSDDNQKRLNSRQIDVPIYEAKMTRDSRLVVRLVYDHMMCRFLILYIRSIKWTASLNTIPT